MGAWDPRLNAWILDRPSDVAAALRDPRLVPAQARSTAPARSLDASAQADFRAQALHALSPAAIQRWEQSFSEAAGRLASALPTGEPIDLLERYARPYSLTVAAITAGVSAEDLGHLAVLAGNIFESACEPYDDALAARLQASIVALATRFQSAPPWTVQMFAALTHSLPALLGNMWLARLEPSTEVLGPAKAVFRQAAAPLTIGDCDIAQNHCVILRLDLAGADFAFGAGLHSCVGAALIKSAAAIATRALFDRFALGPHSAVTADCFAMRYLTSLTVVLSGAD